MWNGNILKYQNIRAVDKFDLVSAIYPGAPIVVTGHSLGGALATHVSLNRTNARAYVFNSSPRFFKTDKCDVPDCGNERDSIVEYGEINKIFRIFGSEPTQTYTSIGCIDGANPLTNHSMRDLAICLASIAQVEVNYETGETVHLNFPRIKQGQAETP